MNTESPRYFAVVAAGGRGARVQADKPKQYLKVHGRTLLEHALQPFLAAPWISTIAVVLPPDDKVFSTLDCSRESRIKTAEAGVTRAESVLSGLRSIAGQAAREDFVLVHDAARPGVRVSDLERLRDEASTDDGGLLAVPVVDTIKRAESRASAATIDRRDLWRAQTPQMFRSESLKRAIEDSLHQGVEATDEARAMEAAGYRPRLVLGHEGNFKVTRPDDLALAAYWLERLRDKP